MTTKIPYGLGELSNEDRLTTIKDRCIGEDLIEMYKVVNEYEMIDRVNFPNLRSNLASNSN